MDPILAQLFSKPTSPPLVNKMIIEQERVLTSLSLDKLTEGFTNDDSSKYVPMSFYMNAASVDTNVGTIQKIQTGVSETQSKILNNYTDLSNNIQTNMSQRKYLSDNNTKYHYDDNQDPNVILNPEESKDIHMAIKEDINQIKYYQHAIYSAYLIAGATLLIAVISLSRNK
jgi:hypothetical protein